MPTAAIMPNRTGPTEPTAGPAALFQEAWQTYRKVVEENYFFHREVCATLRQVLVEEVAAPFRFLDLACGDASATVSAIAGTRIAHYRGIDLSEQALTLARRELCTLHCPVSLERRDFVEALHDPALAADVAFIGLSLHHLRTQDKLDAMSDLRRIVGDTGKLLVYENAGPDGDTREAWIRRWEHQRPTWPALTEPEWQAITGHTRANDFPETHVGWLTLAYEAGFGRARCLYESPTRLFRLYCFEA